MSELLPTLFAIITFTIAFGILFRMMIWPIWRQVRRDEERYQLFAIRDEIIYLSAMKTLESESEFFRVFYRLINSTIEAKKKAKPRQLIRYIMEMKDEEFMSSMIRLNSMINETHPAGQDIAKKYFKTVGQIIYRNSITVRIILVILCPPLFRAVKLYMKVCEWLSKFFEKHFSSFNLYNHVHKLTEC